MFHKSGRVLIAALAVGAALFAGGCAAGTGSALQAPHPPNVATTAEGSIAGDSKATQSSGGSTASESTETGKDTGKDTGENSGENSGEGKETGNGSTSVSEQDIPISSYTPDGTTKKLVTWPKELILPDSASGGASDVQFKNVTWTKWGENGAEGSGDAYITGGGAPPETIHNVRIIVDDAKTVEGARQFTHFLIMYPDGTVNEGRTDF
ncbi:hypothetical protein [Saccharopolyspora sp. NPDC050642]|uniref:hypothetical protein n=1 Tax=Saccharopolyspora sp. NPDC050642 TaxID=3157099 RepID=UPI0033DCE209